MIAKLSEGHQLVSYTKCESEKISDLPIGVLAAETMTTLSDIVDDEILTAARPLGDQMRNKDKSRD